MCGRFTQTKSRKEALEALGDIELPPLFHGRYNVAPTQKVAVIRQVAPKQVMECIWGFKNPRANSIVINARSETLLERSMFKDLLTENRCLILADGFYEWKGNQPYYFQTVDKQLFAFAGLWRDNRCVIITRAADANMQSTHDRMPVIFTSNHWREWLSGFQLSDPPALTARPVSRLVNKVSNDSPACLEPGEVQSDLSLFPEEA
jgi:putative SOS response-associated peptidase YedK